MLNFARALRRNPTQHLDEAAYGARRDGCLRGDVLHQADDVMATIHAALDHLEMQGHFA